MAVAHVCVHARSYPKEPPTLTVLSILAHYLIKDQRPGPSFGQHIAQTVASDASGSTQATAVLVMDTFMVRSPPASLCTFAAAWCRDRIGCLSLVHASRDCVSGH